MNLKACAIGCSLSISYTTGLALNYDLEVVEPIDKLNFTSWQIKQNNNHEYYISYYPQSFYDLAKTVVSVRNTRFDLYGFIANDINNRGELCGSLVRGGVTRPVTWSSSRGFVTVPGRFRTTVMHINDSGDLGGTIDGWNAYVWVGGSPRAIPGASGFATAIHPAGIVAGYLDDGPHGQYPWIYRDGKLEQIYPKFAIEHMTADGTFAGTRTTSYSGQAFAYSNGKVVAFSQANSWLGGINDAGMAVGFTHGYTYEEPIAVLWVRNRNGTYDEFEIAHLINGSPRTAIALNDVANSGVIIGTAEIGGVRQLIRLHPNK